MKQSKRRASPREQEEKEETRPHWKLKNGKAPHWHPCLTRPILPLWLASSSKQSWAGLHSSPEDFPAKLVFESAPYKYTKGPRVPLHALLCHYSCFGGRRTARSLHFTGQLLCAEIHSLWLMENTELRAAKPTTHWACGKAGLGRLSSSRWGKYSHAYTNLSQLHCLA